MAGSGHVRNLTSEQPTRRARNRYGQTTGPTDPANTKESPMKMRLAAALGLAGIAVLLGADPASAAELGRFGRY